MDRSVRVGVSSSDILKNAASPARFQNGVSIAAAESHFDFRIGCLLSLAAWTNNRSLGETSVAFDEAAREASASKCWDDENTRATDQYRLITREQE